MGEKFDYKLQPILFINSQADKLSPQLFCGWVCHSLFSASRSKQIKGLELVLSVTFETAKKVKWLQNQNKSF